MAANLLNKYVWLVSTLQHHGRLSFDEINSLWLDSPLSGGVELPKRTFHKWLAAIEATFGLLIENENRGAYRYYIYNADDVRSGSLRAWLLGTVAVSNLLADCQSIRHRILTEDIPSGRRHLPALIEALKTNHSLMITYHGYWRDEPSTFEVEPYCLRLCKQRWYMVARSPYYDDVRVYGLDRLTCVGPGGHTFVMPDDFSPEAFFYGCYGVVTGDGSPIEDVTIRVTAHQAQYLRSLPLHASQQEAVRTDTHSIFTYTIRPTFDFIQTLLAQGPDLEVLSPHSLRHYLADCTAAMAARYTDAP